MRQRSAPRSRRVLALAATLALSAAACGGGDGDASGADGVDDPTSTTAAGNGSGGDGGTDTAGTGSTGTGSGSGSGDITTAETVPLKLTDLPHNKHGAPLPGRYFYDVDGAKEPVELSIRDVLGDQDAAHFDRTGDLAQLHTETERAEARAGLLQWSARGLHLDAEQRAQNTTSGPNESAVCDYRPDLLVQPGTLTVGATWDDTSTCIARQGDLTLTRERKLTGEVLAASTADVEGRTVETVRIKRVTDTTTTSDSTPPLLLTEHREVIIEWIVAVGLAARVEGTIVDTVSASPRPPRRYTWALRSTTPVQ